MKLYREVKIESAEQAEALPEGALIPIEDKDGPWEKRSDGKFQGAGRILVDAERVLDRIALVPIEAEEVIGTELRHQITDKRYDVHVMRSSDMDNARWQVENNPKSATGRIMRQYRTPWEEAQ